MAQIPIDIPLEDVEVVDAHGAALASRAMITARLAELVTWPTTRIPAHERQLAADVLMGLLRSASLPVRQSLAQRLALIESPPKSILRYLARDEISVAHDLLRDGVGFDDSDLLATVRFGLSAHWKVIAKRKNLSEIVSEALMQTGDSDVIALVLANPRARLSQPAVDGAITGSRRRPELIDLLLQRPELRPTQALVLFWWANFSQRSQIVRRYSAERQTLLSEMGDLFAQAAKENWNDPESRKALQLVERRQRNRQALSRSAHGSLEEAIADADASGMSKQAAIEIGHLCGVKPMTIVRILMDRGGEPIGVLGKAVGLKRPHLDRLWAALRRPMADPGSHETPYGRMLFIYDILSSAKAQTALRYWNWSFSAEARDLSVNMLDSDEDDLAMTPARRNAALLNLRLAGE